MTSAPTPITRAPVQPSIVGRAHAAARSWLSLCLPIPVFVAAWLGLPVIGLTGIPWATAMFATGGLVVLANLALYRFRRSMAQAPESQLDERQVAVRDRAYLEAYRIFSAVVVLALLIIAILPDALERPLSVTYETVQPLLLGVILYGIILPSAIVAWGEPDLDEG